MFHNTGANAFAKNQMRLACEDKRDLYCIYIFILIYFTRQLDIKNTSRSVADPGGGGGAGHLCPGPLTLYGNMTRISVLNSAEKGVDFKRLRRSAFSQK